eukprot:9466647-Pyramimonas_sp.AAC.3
MPHAVLHHQHPELHGPRYTLGFVACVLGTLALAQYRPILVGLCVAKRLGLEKHYLSNRCDRFKRREGQRWGVVPPEQRSILLPSVSIHGTTDHRVLWLAHRTNVGALQPTRPPLGFSPKYVHTMHVSTLCTLCVIYTFLGRSGAKAVQ